MGILCDRHRQTRCCKGLIPDPKRVPRPKKIARCPAAQEGVPSNNRTIATDRHNFYGTNESWATAIVWFTSVLVMVRYTFAQCPEIVLTVSGRKDTLKAREQAMDRIIELMDDDQLPTDLVDGLGPQQLIEVKPLENMAPEGEEDVVQAVQILSNLATLKLKAQELQEEALQIHAKIDILFTDAPTTEAEIGSLKEGFKVLKSFAQANLRYREARTKAKQARQVLDQALQSPKS